MIDWCIQCADIGCILSHHRDKKHRMFAYIFVRIMKDALTMHQESVLLKRLYDNNGNLTNVWALDEKFYKDFIYKEPVGEIIGKFWFKKSYWSFMRHMIEINVSEDFQKQHFNVYVMKNGEVNFDFGNGRKNG